MAALEDLQPNVGAGHSAGLPGILTQWKDVVEKYDAGASQGIVLFNRQGNPQCLVHQDFVNEHRKTQNLEKLRLWLSGERNHWFYRYQKR